MSSILKGLNESVIPVTEESPIDIKIQNALWQAVTNESLSEEYINEIDPGMITNIMAVFPTISKVIVTNAINKAKKEATETSNMISTMKKYRDSQPVTPEEKEQMMSQFKDLITYGAMAVGSVMAGMPAGPGIAIAGIYKKEIMELIKTKGPEVLINLLQTKGNLDVIKILYHKLLAKNALQFYHPAPKGVAESQLDELSNEKLAKYKTAAAADAKKADSEGDYKRGDKRFSGMVQATRKQFDNDTKQVKEFAPVGGDDREPDEEEILRQLAAKWWLGTEQEMSKAQKTLAAMGWDIGQDESGDDDAGVFVIRVGDENGDSYIAFNHSDLEELNEAFNNYHANRTGFSRGQRDDERHDLDPSDWYFVKDGKMFAISVYPRQEQEAIARGYSRTRAEAKAKAGQQGVSEEKQRLDPSCWKGYKKQGTKMKGDTRVNNCVPVKESAILQGLNQLDEGWKEKLGAAALAGSMALGAGGAHARVTPDGQGGFTGGLKPTATVTAPSDNKPAASAPQGLSKEYLQKAADPNRLGRYMISVEKAQELLNQMQGN